MAQRVTHATRVVLTDNPDGNQRVTHATRVVLTDNPDGLARVTLAARVVLVQNLASDAFATDAQWVA